MSDLEINTRVTLSLEDAFLALEEELFKQVNLPPDSLVDEQGRLYIMEDWLDNPNYSGYYFPDGRSNKLIVKKIISESPTEQQLNIVKACVEIRKIIFK